MIFELSFDQTRPGSISTLVTEFPREVERRKKQDVSLVGAWTTEIGIVNQLITLWSYADGGTLERAQQHSQTALAELMKDSGRKVVIRHRQTLLQPVRPVRESVSGSHLYELRAYEVFPGHLMDYVGHMLKAIDMRETYSPNIGLWTPISGNPNKLVHMWAYRNYEERVKVRTTVLDEPIWKTYLRAAQPIIREMRSTLLNPAPFSPLT